MATSKAGKGLAKGAVCSKSPVMEAWRHLFYVSFSSPHLLPPIPMAYPRIFNSSKKQMEIQEQVGKDWGGFNCAEFISACRMSFSSVFLLSKCCICFQIPLPSFPPLQALKSSSLLLLSPLHGMLLNYLESVGVHKQYIYFCILWIEPQKCPRHRS